MTLAASRGVSSFNVAMGDFLHPPEIQGINVAGYTGGLGQPIVVTAVDDVKVAAVSVAVYTDAGVLVEKGAATQSATEPHLWSYHATTNAPSASLKVVADATDLAGQVTEQSKHT